MSNSSYRAYKNALASIPAPGGGCHAYLLTVANLARIAGVERGAAAAEIAAAIPPGKRQVPDREIWDAVNKAYSETQSTGKRKIHRVQRQRRAPVVSATKAGRWIEQARKSFCDDVSFETLIAEYADMSHATLPPFPPDHNGGRADALALLRTLYRDDDRLFMGDKYTAGASAVRTVAEWAEHVETHGTDGLPLYIPNPLTGDQGKTKAGSISYRADDCVKAYRFITAEIDTASLTDQSLLWWWIIVTGAFEPVTVSALTYSGKKSIHALLRVDAASKDEWERYVEQIIFPRLLVPLGVDGACKNESRLSRLPGHKRDDGARQQLLFLDGRQ